VWVFNNQEIKSHEDLHPDCSDIVYVIHYVNGKKYIGKKNVRSTRRLKPTKAQLAIRKNYVRKEFVNIPFVDYEGSMDKKDCPEIKSKEVLYQCKAKRTATYIETALLFEYDAIFNEEYLNKNIAGTHFDNALDGLLPVVDPTYFM
jgi:hypothetical protein